MPKLSPTYLASLLILFSFLSFSATANDCSTPFALTAGGNVVSGGLDATADFISNAQHPCPGPGATGDVWFRMPLPSGSNQTNYDIDFVISSNFTGTINAILLYSETADIPGASECEFPGATGLTGLTRYLSDVAECGITLNGSSQTFSTKGLDGSGVFYLVVERVSGFGGLITVQANIAGTCSPPVYDDCSYCINNGPTLTLGNGIDASYAIPGNPASWSDGFSATTRCATKKRLATDCNANPPTPTEDHYGCYFNIPFVSATCIYNGNLGDLISCPTPNGRIDTWLENTVFFSFTPPTTTLWYVHIASEGPCLQEPNNLSISLFSSLDCANANASSRIATDKFPINGGIPNPNGSLGANLLTGGSTYFIVVDGIRNSQCDFQLLVSPEQVNIILPVTLSAFQGWNEGGYNQLSWETSQETQFDYFEIERSRNGETFAPIGQISGNGSQQNGSTYQFADPNAPLGKAYYRLNMVDLNGSQQYSEVVEVSRTEIQAGIEEVFPNPFHEELSVRFTTDMTQAVEFRLIDVVGKEYGRYAFQLTPGTHTITLPTTELAAGIYLLELSQEGHREVVKVMK